MFGIGIHILLATLNRRDRRIWFVFESITSQFLESPLVCTNSAQSEYSFITLHVLLVFIISFFYVCGEQRMVTQMITESVYVTVYCYPNKELFQWDLYIHIPLLI